MATCCGPGHHQAEVLADRQQLAHQAAGRRRRTRSGSRPGWTASRASGRRGARRASRRRRDGCSTETGLGLPGALEVALVGDQDRAALAAPVDDLAQVLGRQHPPGRVGRRVQPEQRGPLRAERRQRVGGDGPGAGQRRADLVGRVGELGVDDQVSGADAEVDGERRDQLLRADHGQHLVEAEPGHTVGAGQPVERRPAGSRPGRSWSGSPASPRPPAARPARRPGSGRPGCRPRGRRCRPGAAGARSAWPVSLSQGKSGSREETVRAGLRSLVVLLRRERRDELVVLVDLAHLGRTAGRAEVVEEVDVGVVVAPSTAPACRPRRRSPRPGRPARTPRSRRTRRGGCRASACPRRCSPPGTRRHRPGP